MGSKKTTTESIAIASTRMSWHKVCSGSMSPETVKSRNVVLGLYADFLEEKHGLSATTLKWEHFGKEYVTGWMEWLRDERHDSPQTVNHHLAILREFVRYAAGENKKTEPSLVVIYGDLKEIRLLKAVAKQVEPLSEAAEEAVRKVAGNAPRTGLRDKLLVSLLLDNGLRISEAVGIKLRDIHLNQKDPHIKILGKGNKERMAFLGDGVLGPLREYLAVEHGDDSSSGRYLFFSRQSGPTAPISVRALEKAIEKIGKEAKRICQEVPENLHPHVLRHSYASDAIKNGMDPIVLQHCLGHEQLTTTMRYVTITNQMIAAAQKKLANKHNNDDKSDLSGQADRQKGESKYRKNDKVRRLLCISKD